jgi:hypothetical protein
MATKEIADFGFECAATSKHHHKRISATGLVGTCTNMPLLPYTLHDSSYMRVYF